MIRFACPHCKKVQEAVDTAGGSVASCNGCSQKLRIPQPARPTPAAPAAPPVAPPPVRTSSTPVLATMPRLSIEDAPPPLPEVIPVVVPVRVPAAQNEPILLEEDVPEVPVVYPVDAPREPVAAVSTTVPPTPDTFPPQRETAFRKMLVNWLPPEVAALGNRLFIFEDADMAILGFILAVGVIGLGLFVVFVSCTRPPNESTKMAQMTVVFFWLGLAAIPGGALWIYQAYRVLMTWTVVFEKGFVVSKAGKQTIWRWEDIVALRTLRTDTRVYAYGMQMNRYNTETHTLRHHIGEKYAFSRTADPGVGVFCDLFARKTAELIRRETLCRLSRGEPAPFDPFTVGVQGLTYTGRLVPWRDITELGMRNGRLLIQESVPPRKPIEVEIALVDNFHVFFPLLQEGIAGKLPR